MKNRSKENGTEVNDWVTPQYIWDYLDRVFFKGVKYFDPCPLFADFDGLRIPWHRYNYVNPPYARKLKEAFILKALDEFKKGNETVMLIPATTDTKIFHEALVPYCHIQLIKGRVKFCGFNTKREYVTDKTGQTGSMFVIFAEHYKKEIITIELDHFVSPTEASSRQGVGPAEKPNGLGSVKGMPRQTNQPDKVLSEAKPSDRQDEEG